MVPRAFTIVAVSTACLLASIAAAGLSEGSLVGHASVPGDPPTRQPPAPVSFGSAGSGLPGWLMVAMTILIVLYAAALLAFVASRLRRRDHDEDAAPWPDEVPLDSVWGTVLGVTLANAAEAQLALLHRGTPRNAIVACWMGLQAATFGAGLTEVPSETAEEYLVRAVGRLGLNTTAVTALATLYREARFSDHEMREEHRAQAGRALRVLADQLPDRRTGRMHEKVLQSVPR
jgi:Domain of unknown function (DUF4129)